MVRSDKKLENLSSLLNKNNEILIISAIELLREEQPFEGAIALITAFYDQTDNNKVRKAIESFMNDLKDQSMCSEVINEIRKSWKPDTTSMLVASCWQSGLDYSEYSSDLAEVFLKADYITALECLTVIEESVNAMSQDKKDELLKMIAASEPSPINEKKSLALELISILGG
jgi:hypothetical protein